MQNNGLYISLPPPEKVLLIAPMIEDVFVVLKNLRKLGEAMTSVMTPAINKQQYF